ncbi:hypothetical protein [Nocardia lijiangensis]|uniref:hypothetical protein n=1 Tax=Nocardia lijiangensis TaxID=299618 RepID=UPI003D75EFE4
MVSQTDDGAGSAQPDAQKFDEAFVALERTREFMREAWRPFDSMEGLVLKVLGGWTMVISEVEFAYFSAVGTNWTSPKNPNKIAATARQAAELQGVIWPHDEWSEAVAKCSTVRHRLAHLMYVEEVTDEPPSRVMTFARLGRPGATRAKPGQPASELSWRTEDIPQQTWHTDRITEIELADTLATEHWLYRCVLALGRLHSIRELVGGTVHDKPMKGAAFVPWWQENRPPRMSEIWSK